MRASSVSVRSLVRCEPRQLSDGVQLVAVELVVRPG